MGFPEGRSQTTFGYAVACLNLTSKSFIGSRGLVVGVCFLNQLHRVIPPFFRIFLPLHCFSLSQQQVWCPCTLPSLIQRLLPLSVLSPCHCFDRIRARGLVFFPSCAFSSTVVCFVYSFPSLWFSVTVCCSCSFLLPFVHCQYVFLALHHIKDDVPCLFVVFFRSFMLLERLGQQQN